MPRSARTTSGFPHASLPSSSGGLPIEVSLIAQLGHGGGDRLYASALARQRSHAHFIDALDEPSARLGGVDLARGDATSLYSFAVGAKGHPFHRHAGHRVFTAISGSGGAQLRFSTATQAEVENDPHCFVQALRHINIPPDCLFTVRFGGDTWHQFVPLSGKQRHPAFFALSCHTNELGGELSDATRQQVLANAASIPALTVVLPDAASDLLNAIPAHRLHVPTVQLSLDAAPGTLHALFCKGMRCAAGMMSGAIASWRRSRGFFSQSGGRVSIIELDTLPPGSLLEQQLADTAHHQDIFSLSLSTAGTNERHASVLLSRLLEGFLSNPPEGVRRMMAMRNALVRPLGLRTSPLGCPVSSLLSPARDRLFLQRFPVLDQRVDDDDRRAQVILGADDKHLTFRSCVGVHVVNAHRVNITLGTRVHCRNHFGRLYITLIERIHRSYIAPTMLRMAVEHAFPATVATSFEQVLQADHSA